MNNFSQIKAEYFSMGILLFGLVMAAPPFDIATYDNPEFQILLSGTAQFWRYWAGRAPHIRLSPDLVHLLNGLLTIDPKTRFGYAEVVRSAWVRTPVDPCLAKMEIAQKLAHVSYMKSLGFVGPDMPCSKYSRK